MLPKEAGSRWLSLKIGEGLARSLVLNIVAEYRLDLGTVETDDRRFHRCLSSDFHHRLLGLIARVRKLNKSVLVNIMNPQR